MSTKQKWEPLETVEAVLAAFKAGRHVEFTACGCDYDLPGCKEDYFGSEGWIIPSYPNDRWRNREVKTSARPSRDYRYRALVEGGEP